MEATIARHYDHYPLAALPGFVRHALARRWRARDDILYVEARNKEGRFLGFIFGQDLGNRPWRKLLARPFWVLPFAVFARLRRFWHVTRNPVATPNAIDIAVSPRSTSAPFTTIEFLYVQPDARGQGIAGHLLGSIETDLKKAGAQTMKAWISEFNPASIAVFRKAGWDIRQASTNKLIAIRTVGQAK